MNAERLALLAFVCFIGLILAVYVGLYALIVALLAF